MRKWANLANTGELSIEKVLIDLDIPLLFVCVNKNNERHLVMCIDDEELEYLFVRVDETELIHLISTGCGLRAIFTKAGKKIRRVVLTQSLNDEFIAKSKITDDMLPGKKVRYDFSDKDNEGYIEMLNSITIIKCVVIQASNKSVAACHPIRIPKRIPINANEKKALFVKEICEKRVNLVKDNSKSSRKLKGKKNFS